MGDCARVVASRHAAARIAAAIERAGSLPGPGSPKCEVRQQQESDPGSDPGSDPSVRYLHISTENSGSSVSDGSWGGIKSDTKQAINWTDCGAGVRLRRGLAGC